ncbi:hypothetical protein GALMADRAFT_148281 [Galerina marginata CBS 339.88]|uniref:Uncharacterized protein n=1 Tax=Galerina marginata (strain CBS 339.88) TaxID=685588 RepID=A0A067S501_GALM3|nr:hypothetical protein GALMADRAFT_148281 [Galerina marginata CBS 339.88]
MASKTLGERIFSVDNVLWDSTKHAEEKLQDHRLDVKDIEEKILLNQTRSAELNLGDDSEDTEAEGLKSELKSLQLALVKASKAEAKAEKALKTSEKQGSKKKSSRLEAKKLKEASSSSNGPQQDQLIDPPLLEDAGGGLKRVALFDNEMPANPLESTGIVAQTNAKGALTLQVANDTQAQNDSQRIHEANSTARDGQLILANGEDAFTLQVANDTQAQNDSQHISEANSTARDGQLILANGESTSISTRNEIINKPDHNIDAEISEPNLTVYGAPEVGNGMQDHTETGRGEPVNIAGHYLVMSQQGLGTGGDQLANRDGHYSMAPSYGRETESSYEERIHTSRSLHIHKLKRVANREGRRIYLKSFNGDVLPANNWGPAGPFQPEQDTDSWESRAASTAIQNDTNSMPMQSHAPQFYTTSDTNLEWNFDPLTSSSLGVPIDNQEAFLSHTGISSGFGDGGTYNRRDVSMNDPSSGPVGDGRQLFAKSPMHPNQGHPNSQSEDTRDSLMVDGNGNPSNSFSDHTPRDVHGHSTSSSLTEDGQNHVDMDGDIDMEERATTLESDNVRKAQREMERTLLLVMTAQFNLDQESLRLSESEAVASDDLAAKSKCFKDVRVGLEFLERKVDGWKSELAMANAEYQAAKEKLDQEFSREEVARLQRELIGLKALCTVPQNYPIEVIGQFRKEIKQKTGRIAYLAQYVNLADNESLPIGSKRKPSLEDIDDVTDEQVQPREPTGKKKGKARKVKKEPEDRLPKEGTGPLTGIQRLESLGKISSTWLTQLAPKIIRVNSERLSLPMLSDDDCKWAEDEGQRQIDLFLAGGQEKVVHATVRKWCVSFPRYLPHCAWASLALALLVHKSKQGGTLRCRFHAINRSDRVKAVFDREFANKVEGVSHEVRLNSELPALPGHFHCGCLIDHVLVDFFIWKTVSAGTNENPLDTESMRQDAFQPRMRSFLLASHQQFSGFSAEDIPFQNPPPALSVVIDNLQMKLVFDLVNDLIARGHRLRLLQDGTK